MAVVVTSPPYHIADTNLSSSRRTPGPITPGFAVETQDKATGACTNIDDTAYGSLRSQGRRDVSPHSRDTHCPRFSKSFALSSNRGRREDRVRAAPAVSCALMHKEMRTRAYRFSGNTPAFPAQWLYGLYRALPGESEPLATIAPERRWPLKDLTPAIRASGPHDLAVRIGAARPHASSARRRLCVHHVPSRAKRRSRYAPLVGRDGAIIG